MNTCMYMCMIKIYSSKGKKNNNNNNNKKKKKKKKMKNNNKNNNNNNKKQQEEEEEEQQQHKNLTIVNYAARAVKKVMNGTFFGKNMRGISSACYHCQLTPHEDI